MKIVIQSDVADQIRKSDGPIELIDDQGASVGRVWRPPTEEEIEEAKTHMHQPGPKFTFEQLFAKIEEL